MPIQNTDIHDRRGASVFSCVIFLAILGGLAWGGHFFYERYYSKAKKLRSEANEDMNLVARILQRHYRQEGKWPQNIPSLTEKELEEINRFSPWGEEYFILGDNVVCHEEKNMARKLLFPFRNVSNWEYEYKAMKLPHEDNGGWNKIGAGFAEIQNGDCLNLKDDAKGGSIKFRRNFSPLEVDHEYGYAIEMEVRVNKGFPGDFFVTVNDGAKVYTLSLYSDKVVFKAGTGMVVASKAADLSSYMCVLRLIVGDGDYFVSLNGDMLMILPEKKITYNTNERYLTIGLDSRGNTNASAELKRFCLTTNGPMH